MEARVVRPLAAAGGCATALVAVVFCAYFVAPIERWDASALHGLREITHDHARLSTPAAVVAHSADPAVVLTALGAICVACLVAGRRRQALAGVLIVAGAAVTTGLLKALLAHPRHQAALAGLHLGDNAFPSGHATMMMALALTAVIAAPERWRRPVALAAAATTVAVSMAIVADGWHYPSDVLGGYLVSVSIALLVVAGLRAEGRRERRPSGGIAASMAWRRLGLQALALIAAGALGALALIAAVRPSQLASFSAANTSAVIAAIALAALAVGLVHALAAELETRS